MLVNILITTYNRPDKLKKLVDSLSNQDFKGEIVVFNDGSTRKYDKVNARVFKFPYNHGKQRYYELVNHLFRSRGNADYYIMIPDDIEVGKDFITHAVDKWNGIDDDKKICLNLLADNRTECWTKFKRQDKGDNWLTQWNDCSFIVEEKFFEEVGNITISAKRWHYNKMLGSGVGEFISNNLYGKNYNMYQVKTTLVRHGEHVSVMNPQARKENPLKT